MTKCRVNSIYRTMKQRCCNPKSKSYEYYGGRGITVCSEWLDSEIDNTVKGCNTKGWLAFKKWALENGYQDGLTLDRIDVNKGYSPDNCRWVTIKEQANNKSDNHFITYKGKTQTLMQWCEELNLGYNQTYKRIIIRNWEIEKAFEISKTQEHIMITYKGKTQCLKDWCKELNLNYSTTYKRIMVQHWAVIKAFKTIKESVS